MKKLCTVIMKSLLVVLLTVLAFVAAQAQTEEKKLIADETYLAQSEKSFKIITSNDLVSGMLLVEFDDSIKTYTVSKKKDRHGDYREFRVTLPIEMMPKVVQAIQKLGTDEKKTAVRPTRKH